MMSHIVPDFRLENLWMTSAPGYALEVVGDYTASGHVVMGLQRAMTTTLAPDTMEVFLQTNRGDIPGILTLGKDRPGGVLWVGGRGESLNGPAGAIYADLAQELKLVGISSLRMTYRNSTVFEEDVLDALVCLSVLKGMGIQDLVIVGYGLGGAVAVAAAAICPSVKAVAALSSPVEGTELVDRIAPRPLLLIHGEQDTQTPPSASQDIYGRAGDPKELVIYPNASTALLECRAELGQKLGSWLLDRLGQDEVYLELKAGQAAEPARVVKTVSGPAGAGNRELILTRDDLVTMDIDAIICPTGSWLDLRNSSLGRAVVEQGGMVIQDELWGLAPLVMGDVGVTEGGRLKAKYVFHAITGGAGSGDEPMPTEAMIAQATGNALLEADQRGVKSIAFPALASGNRGFPPEKTAWIMVAIIARHLGGQTSLDKVVFSMPAEGPYRAFQAQLDVLP